jgi:hypothetical protein
MQRFRDVTDGSPTFAASILRILSRGMNLDQALSRWKGADGNIVRRFAFERELEHLTGSQLRTLYAACLLGDTSAVELQNVLQSNEGLVNDDIGVLRNYHLVVSASALPGGAGLRLPSSIRLLADIIKKRLHDPKAIERECERLRNKTLNGGSEVGRLAARVVALWKDGKPEEALEVAQLADQRYADHADIKCLLGHAFLKLPKPDPQKAEASLRGAWRLGCSRPELLSLWIEAKRQLKDWMGVLEITKDGQSGQIIVSRAAAYSALADIALRSNAPERAARHLSVGAQEMRAALETQHAKGRELEVGRWMRNLARAYVNVLDQYTAQPGDRLDVWHACVEVFRANDGDAELLIRALRNLGHWWSSVEKRDYVDIKAHDILVHQLRTAAKILGDERARDRERDLAILQDAQKLITELHGKANRYNARTRMSTGLRHSFQ